MLQGNVNGYVADLMRQYGNRGQKWHLPERDEAAFQRALQHRRTEKQRYIEMEDELRTLREEYDDLLDIHNNTMSEVEMLISNFKMYDVGSGDRRRGGRGDGGDGRGVLPPVQDHDEAREKPQLKLSNAQQSEHDERTDDGGSRVGSVPAVPEDVPDGAAAEAGGERPDPAADLGGQTSEHRTEE